MIEFFATDSHKYKLDDAETRRVCEALRGFGGSADKRSKALKLALRIEFQLKRTPERRGSVMLALDEDPTLMFEARNIALA